MHKQGCTQKQIAEAIGKDKSVVCRELKHNVHSNGKYSFTSVHEMATSRKERMKSRVSYFHALERILSNCSE
jgi:IS30 family transposase